MLDVLNPGSPALSIASSVAVATLSSAPLAPVTRAEKREAIDRELRADPHRSDNQIARSCDVDHKTVAARRREIQIPNDGANSRPITTTDTTTDTAAAIAATAVARAIIGFGGKCPPPPGVVDEPDIFAADSEDLVIPHQPAVAVYENTVGAVVIRQAADGFQDEDPVIQVRPEHVEKLVARLRKVAAEARE